MLLLANIYDLSVEYTILYYIQWILLGCVFYCAARVYKFNQLLMVSQRSPIFVLEKCAYYVLRLSPQ